MFTVNVPVSVEGSPVSVLRPVDVKTTEKEVSPSALAWRSSTGSTV